MNFAQIFEAYYNLYRSEATTPSTTDDEYPVALRLANEAINRWEHYDNTMWHELYTTAQAEGGGTLTISTGVSTYTAPDNMQQPGGDVKLFDTVTGKTVATIKVIQPEDVQFMGDMATYAYFVGDPNNGYTLNINPVPTIGWNGYGINYVFYKKATRFSSTNSTLVTEMNDPYFIVNRMLANRFRSSRNPYYGSAKTDAEDSLRTMQLTNNSGTWTTPWSLPDRSGTQWGS